MTAAPLSLQWSQKNVVLSLDSAKAGTSAAGVSRRVHRKAYRRAAYGTAVAGSGGYGYSSLANCDGNYLAYGTSYVAPCGQYSSSYAIAEERLKAGYSVAPYSYYGPSPAPTGGLEASRKLDVLQSGPKAPARPGLSFTLCVSAGAEPSGKCGVGQSVASGFSCLFHARMIAAKPCA